LGCQFCDDLKPRHPLLEAGGRRSFVREQGSEAPAIRHFLLRLYL
jgi:hypothetical protein